LVFRNREQSDGTKIFKEGIDQREAGDEEAQGRDPEERSIGPQGQEPQAGDCDRPFRGAQEGCESAEEGEKAQGEAVILVMPGLVPGIHVFLSCSEEVVDGRDKPGHDD
jgi:hypothetical protein